MLVRPDQWQRSGRGRTIEFFATDDDLLLVFRHALPGLDSYRVIGVERVSEDRRYRVVPFESLLSDLSASVLSNPKRWQYWIYRLDKEGDLDCQDWTDPRAYSLSGFILVEHGSTDETGGRRPSAFGLVDRVKNIENGRVIRQDNYKAEYEGLARTVRSTAVATTAPSIRGDVKVEKNALWLPGAVDAWREGDIKFTFEPDLPRTNRSTGR